MKLYERHLDGRKFKRTYRLPISTKKIQEHGPERPMGMKRGTSLKEWVMTQSINACGKNLGKKSEHRRTGGKMKSGNCSQVEATNVAKSALRHDGSTAMPTTVKNYTEGERQQSGQIGHLSVRVLRERRPSHGQISYEGYEGRKKGTLRTARD